MGNCISGANGTRASNGEGVATAQQPNFYADAATLIAHKARDAINAKKGQSTFTRDAPSAQYNAEAQKTIPAVIRMFSGCKDNQTSADVYDVSSFGLPVPDPREKAGGACTNGLLHTLKNHPASAGPLSFGALLTKMQATLKERKYTQIPQLSSSHNARLNEEKFTVWNPENKSGRSRALLIGINYYGSKSQLNGCINDVHMMKDYLTSQGFSTAKSDMRVLTDDGKNDGSPTGVEIMRGLKWLTEGAKAGDSLFLHFSGHGTQTKDLDGDEADGMDEAIVPVDYEKNGLIIDDTLFQICAGTLPKGAHLVCLFDCCHSGTMMDLPYIFSANGEAVAALEAGEDLEMAANPGFNMAFAQQLISSIAKGIINQVLKSQSGGDGEKTNSGGGASSSLQSEMLKIAQGFIGGIGNK